MTHPHASSPPSLAAGSTHTVTLAVGPRDLASSHATDAGESYPDVLSTPAVVALLERACAAMLRPLLGEGELSVGARMAIAHTAPTPPGVQVRGHAEFLRQEKRLFIFRVQAEDPAGVIATGEHARAIVPRAKVEAAALERGGCMSTAQAPAAAAPVAMQHEGTPASPALTKILGGEASGVCP